MNKSVSFFSAAVIAISCFMSCQQNKPAAFSDQDRDAIRAVVKKGNENMNARDFKTHAGTYYAADASILPPNGGAVKGSEAIEKFFQSFPNFVIESNDLEIDGLGDMAYMYGRYKLAFKDMNMTDEGKYIEIWRKQADGSWKVTYDIFNSDVPVPAGPVSQ